MILLRSNERFDDVRQFDPRTGTLSESATLAAENGKIAGAFSQQGPHVLVFYRSGGALFVGVDSRIVLVDSATTSQWRSAPDGDRHLSILHGETPVLNYDYRLQTDEMLTGEDPTPFVDEEDFDFGQFVHNVLSSPKRTEFVFTANQPAHQTAKKG